MITFFKRYKEEGMKNLAVVLLAIPLCAVSQTTRSGTFALNDYVNLSTGARSSILIPNERSQVVYPCSTSAANRDLFINYFEHSTCICVCPSGAVGSPRPFYKSKISFGAMNLTTPLDLADTARYTRVDTVRQTGCALPYSVIDLYGSYNETGVFIMTTSDNKYVLLRLSQIVNTVQCYDYDYTTGATYQWTQSRLGGFTATWYLTSSGQPYFGWIPRANIAGKPQAVTPRRLPNTLSPTAEVYSLLGRKIGIARGGLERPGIGSSPSLFIVKDGQSVRPMLK
jgi:hypothetical protein